jgi:hypothetical protein
MAWHGICDLEPGMYYDTCANRRTEGRRCSAGRQVSERGAVQQKEGVRKKKTPHPRIAAARSTKNASGRLIGGGCRKGGPGEETMTML